MKRNFLAFLLFVHTLLFAGSVVTVKKISEKEKITYYPKQGESFRVSIDLNRFVRGANYDIMMRNGKIIYFENKKQTDDIYFVFNEPVDRGDEILLKVNRGHFIYTTQSVEDLPKPIKKVLQVNEKEQKSKKASKTNNDKVTIKTKEYCFDDKGEVFECKSPSVAKMDSSSSMRKRGILPNESANEQKQEPKTPNFIELFSKKLQMAYEKIKTTLTSSSQKKAQEEIKSSQKENARKEEKQEKESIKKEQSVQKKIEKTLPATPPKELLRENELITEKIDLPNPKIVNPPLPSSDSVAAATSVLKPRIKSPSFVSKIAQDSSIANKSKILTPELSDNFAKELPKVLKEDKSNQIAREYRPNIKEPQRISPYDNLNTPVAQPVYKEVPSSKILQRRLKESDISAAKTTPPNLQNKEFVSATPISQKTHESDVSESMNIKGDESNTHNIKKPTQTRIVEVKKMKPIAQEVANEEEEPKDKIVITKIIEKKPSSKSSTDAFPQRMSERVLGGGYKETNGMGSVSVKAYSNLKPVSAWVEVYQNKKRVKSFYTGRSKPVKLPAGTYVLKATYRTGTSKQKKVLGKIKLAEGQSIRKKVHFKIGTLNVIAKRDNKPLYVKVEIYKKGSHSRYAYTFSSRNTGIAHLKLSEGTYKIVVKDRAKKRTFNDIFIKGAALKSVVAEF